jgi:phosphatidate phosphatase APP1
MNVLLQATVNAIYNYWGDSSGPHHASLNPSGKGNQVGGDGINLDFIPFLTAPIGYINERPTAELLTDKNLVSPNEPVTFIATTSSDDKRVDQYFFNFGDGKNSGWTTLSVFVYKYSSIGNYSASVIVMDDFGVTSSNVAVADITVKTGLTPHDTSLTLSHPSINSEGQVLVTVRAAEGANIRLMSDRKGSFVPSSGIANTTGYFTATFTAPSVTERTYVRITATASKAGYADGSDYEYLVVLPVLTVEVIADPVAIKSEATSNVTVHVTHNSHLISDAIVTLSSDGGGSFDPEIGITNANGSVTFTFKAPQVITQLNVTVTATATKSNYFEGKGQTTITINPRILVVQVTANPNTVESGEKTKIIIHVTEDLIPIEGANVTVACIGGDFLVTGSTDSKGDFELDFTAPQTTTQLSLTITANATKSGYVKGEDQTTILVNPIPLEPVGVSGLPLTTILMIAIPIIVIVIIAILFKAKVIVISREES